MYPCFSLANSRNESQTLVLGPGGRVLTVPGFKKRCELAVRGESCHGYRPKEKQDALSGRSSTKDERPSLLFCRQVD